MVATTPGPLADPDLAPAEPGLAPPDPGPSVAAPSDVDGLANEWSRLANVAGWYRTTDGIYNKIVWYAYLTIRPFLHGEHCLEMGPADGGMTRFLKNDFARLSLVDAAEEYLHRAQGLGDNIVGHLSLFEEFEPIDLFDTVVMSHVLEHVYDPVQVLDRARSWLRPGGRIIAIVPNAGSVHRRLGVKLGLLERLNQLNDQDLSIGHRRVYHREDFDRDVRAAGLHIVGKGGIFFKPLSSPQMQIFDDERLIDAMFELGKDLPDLCSEIYSVAVSAPPLP